MVIGDMPLLVVGSRCPRGPFCIPFRTSSKPMVVSLERHLLDCVFVGCRSQEASPASSQDRLAGVSSHLLGLLFVLGGAETGRGGVLLAHIGAVLGLSVSRAVTVVIDLRIRVDPNNRVGRAMSLGGQHGRVLGRRGISGRARRGLRSRLGSPASLWAGGGTLSGDSCVARRGFCAGLRFLLRRGARLGASSGGLRRGSGISWRGLGSRLCASGRRLGRGSCISRRAFCGRLRACGRGGGAT